MNWIIEKVKETDKKKYQLMEKFAEQQILDNGFVRLIDLMGDDAAVVAAARQSYTEDQWGEYENSERLIRYMMGASRPHTSPFEMCEIKLQVRVPMDCWRQWIRHRTASVNEKSTRYTESDCIFATTDPGGWRMQSTSNKQGSSEKYLPETNGEVITRAEALVHEVSHSAYQQRISNGIAREQARKDLPLSTYTTAVWKIDLHNLFHFLWLRLDRNAQWEIRQYARAIANIVKEWVPICWDAFKTYRMDSITLSSLEIRALKSYYLGKSDMSDEFLGKIGMSKRETRLFREKLEKIYM